MTKSKGKTKNPRSSEKNSKRAKLSENEIHKRNWAELDSDILSIIFMKVGAIDLLEHAQLVCKPWRTVSFNPCIWKVADFTSLEEDRMDDIDLEKMTREAVDRSKGQMEELWIKFFGSDELLSYVADRTSILKRLRLISVDGIYGEGLIDMLKRQPKLEELDITLGDYLDEILEDIGKAYPNLGCLRYNQVAEWCDEFEYGIFEYNGYAHDIANNMPELRVLQLVGNPLNNIGLLEILDKCKHLEILDIRCCFNVCVCDEIKAKAKGLKEFRLPLDSIDDYEFGVEDEFDMSHYNDDDEDNDGDSVDDGFVNECGALM